MNSYNNNFGEGLSGNFGGESLPNSYVEPFAALTESGARPFRISNASSVPGNNEFEEERRRRSQRISNISSSNAFNGEDPSTLPYCDPASSSMTIGRDSKAGHTIRDREKSMSNMDYSTTKSVIPRNDYPDTENLDLEQEYTEIQRNLLKAVTRLFTEASEDSCKAILNSLRESLDVLIFLETPKNFYVLIRLASIYHGLNDEDAAARCLNQAEEDEKRWRDALKADITEYSRWRRILYTMKADMLKNSDSRISENYLKKSWEISQEYFEDAQEDYLDFRSVILGQIAEGKRDLKKARELYLDALSLRLEQNEENSRLISSSYNDLARIEKALGNKGAAEEYLKSALEYRDKFANTVKSYSDEKDGGKIASILARGEVCYRKIIYTEI